MYKSLKDLMVTQKCITAIPISDSLLKTVKCKFISVPFLLSKLNIQYLLVDEELIVSGRHHQYSLFRRRAQLRVSGRSQQYFLCR